MFGLGNGFDPFYLEDGNYTGWVMDEERHDCAGDHPYMLATMKSGKAVGIYFKNSNAKITNVK